MTRHLRCNFPIWQTLTSQHCSHAFLWEEDGKQREALCPPLPLVHMPVSGCLDLDGGYFDEGRGTWVS